MITSNISLQFFCWLNQYSYHHFWKQILEISFIKLEKKFFESQFLIYFQIKPQNKPHLSMKCYSIFNLKNWSYFSSRYLLGLQFVDMISKKLQTRPPLGEKACFMDSEYILHKILDRIHPLSSTAKLAILDQIQVKLLLCLT